MNQIKSKRYNKIILIILSLILILFYSFYIIISYSDSVNNLINAYILEKHVKNNKLNLPFPYNEGYNRYNVIKLFNKNLTDFYNDLKLNFKYEQGTYDCKYWSYIWLNWWKFHKDEYKVKIITLDNHIFVLVYNNNEYIILDENYIKKIELKNGYEN